jgi:hypothetical protein
LFQVRCTARPSGHGLRPCCSCLHSPGSSYICRDWQCADPEFTWYPLLTPSELFVVLQFVLGQPLVITALALLGITAILQCPAPERASTLHLDHSWILVVASAAGVGILVVLGFIRPSFTLRYLVPFAPGLLFGLAVTVHHLGKRWAPAPMIYVLVLAAAACRSGIGQQRDGQSACNIEVAAKALIATNVKNPVFFRDHPGTPIPNPDMLDAIGRFFFRRAGRSVKVTPIVPGRHDDPNPRLVEAARHPNSGILWIYDLDVQGTSGQANPPRIASLDPSWRCRISDDPASGSSPATGWRPRAGATPVSRKAFATLVALPANTPRKPNFRRICAPPPHG